MRIPLPLWIKNDYEFLLNPTFGCNKEDYSVKDTFYYFIVNLSFGYNIEDFCVKLFLKLNMNLGDFS